MTAISLHSSRNFRVAFQHGLPDHEGAEEFALLLKVVLCFTLRTTRAEVPGEQRVFFLVQVGFCESYHKLPEKLKLFGLVLGPILQSLFTLLSR